MARHLILEPFDEPAFPAAEPGPTADWVAGHATGHTAGLTEAAMRENHLRSDVAQAIMDITFTYAEARQQVLQSLESLLVAIMDRLLPEIGQEVLLPYLVNHALAAARHDSQSPLTIRLHPAVVRSICDALPATMPIAVVIEPDPMLIPGQALLRHRAAETILDIDGLLVGTRAAFAALFDANQGKISNG